MSSCSDLVCCPASWYFCWGPSREDWVFPCGVCRYSFLGNIWEDYAKMTKCSSSYMGFNWACICPYYFADCVEGIVVWFPWDTWRTWMRETGDYIFHCGVLNLLLIRRKILPLMIQGKQKLEPEYLQWFFTVLLEYSLCFKFLSMTNELHLDRFQ